MPSINYDYRTLNAIDWPTANNPVAANITACVAAPTNVLQQLPNPINPSWVNLTAAVMTTCVYPGPRLMNALELAWRLNALRCAAQTNPAGHLGGTPIFTEVDPTDKGTLSYSVGSTLTALLANRIGTFNFIHLSRFERANPNVIAFRNAQRPDFLSQDFLGNFQVWEAKGRTGGGVPATLRDAFTQAWAVQTIFGGVPNGRVAVMAQAHNNGNWDLHLTDPNSGQISTISPIQQDRLFQEYYRPWIEFLMSATESEGISYNESTFKVVQFQLGGITLGLDEKIINAFSENKLASQSGALSENLLGILKTTYKNDNDGEQFVNTNGLYVRLGKTWSES